MAGSIFFYLTNNNKNPTELGGQGQDIFYLSVYSHADFLLKLGL